MDSCENLSSCKSHLNRIENSARLCVTIRNCRYLKIWISVENIFRTNGPIEFFTEIVTERKIRRYFCTIFLEIICAIVAD